MRVTISENLRALRAKEQYTIEYVAHQLGLSPRGYSKIEKGQSKNVSIERLEQLANLYKVSLSVLLEQKVKTLEIQDKVMSGRLDRLEKMMAIMMKEITKIRGTGTIY
jgi:transcriptional regulator with XRE-family HTH domain